MAIEVFLIRQEEKGVKPDVQSLGVIDPIEGPQKGCDDNVIDLDLSRMRNGLRRERIVTVFIPGLGKRSVSIARSTGYGVNILSSGEKIGVQVYEFEGRKYYKPNKTA